MARAKRRKDQSRVPNDPDPKWLESLNREAPVAGVPGPGRWLVVEYRPTSLFSLKTSQATSSVGVSLVIPTPYVIKMAFVDAGFRTGLSDEECDHLLQSLVTVDVRIAPCSHAVVTNTFLKVRQESRPPDWNKKKQTEEQYRASLVQKLVTAHPSFSADACRTYEIDTLKRLISSTYDSTIAYRELAYLTGTWNLAFDLAYGDETTASRLVKLGPHVNYAGKRGSFIQFLRFFRLVDLGTRFTRPLRGELQQVFPAKVHVRLLDDFGPEADLQTLSSFTSLKPERHKHRKFVETIIPAGLVNTGPGFSEYRTD